MEREALLRRLADGESHSGEDLARDFGVTRAAVWKQVAKLKDWGLAVHAVPGQGYRLKQTVDLLDAKDLRARLRANEGACPHSVEVFIELESTNRYLLEQRSPEPGALRACVAEYQSAGRGRRGRSWTAPLAAGLCLSAAWQFRETPQGLAALTLAVGVVVRRVLERVAEIRIALNWPNDLVWHDRKLGGILVEMTAEAYGCCHVVVGMGLNVAMSAELLDSVSNWDTGAVDLARATNGRSPRRTALAAELIEAFGLLFTHYEREGFAPYRDEWRAADYLMGKRISLEESSGPTFGTAHGIGEDGALLLETAQGLSRRVISGDVSVRPAS